MRILCIATLMFLVGAFAVSAAQNVQSDDEPEFLTQVTIRTFDSAMDCFNNLTFCAQSELGSTPAAYYVNAEALFVSTDQCKGLRSIIKILIPVPAADFFKNVSLTVKPEVFWGEDTSKDFFVNAEAFFKALNQSAVVKKLTIDSGWWTNEDFWLKTFANAAYHLAEAIKTNTALTSLKLSQARWISNANWISLFNALKVNKTIRTLDLYCNMGLKKESIQSLSDMLKTNDTLTSVILAVSDLKADEVAALSEALKTNKSLTSLDVRNNFFGEKGLKSLHDALGFNSTLKVLFVFGDKYFLAPQLWKDTYTDTRINWGETSFYDSNKNLSSEFFLGIEKRC